MRAHLACAGWVVGAAGQALAQQDGGPALGSQGEPAPGVRIERHAPEAQERLQKLLDEDAAAARNRTGRVHPRLFDIQRTAQETFLPTWDFAEDHPRAIGSVKNTAKEIGRSVVRSWMVGAPRYASNSPMPVRPRHPGTIRPGEEDDPSLLDHYDEHVRSAVDEANALSSIVCVDLAPGRDATAVVTRTSGRGRFDRLVKSSALAAVGARPLPADLWPVRACYRFTAHFATVPPVPWLSCSLEKSSRTNDRCLWPLKRLVFRDVDLISVK